MTGATPSRLGVAAAMASLYFIWGSTYLAIRIAIETIPPFTMAGSRFLVAGTLLYAWAAFRGAPRPSRRDLLHSAVIGVLLLLLANGAVVWSEQWVASGLVALLVATVPLWMVVVDWIWGEGGRPGVGVAVGLVWGFFGVVVLVGSEEIGGGGRLELLGGLVVLAGAAIWAAGSIYARYARLTTRPRMGTAIQMLVAGALFLVTATATGELRGFAPEQVSLRSLVALVYLIVFGAVVGFTAFIWLMRVSRPALVSTYAYVNPVVALLLGWGFAGEPLRPRTFLAAGIILSAVILITRRSGGTAPGRPRGLRVEKS